MAEQLIERLDTTWRKPPMTAHNVLAVWLQNLGGGLGASVLAGVLAWQLGADGWNVARWAALAGSVVFGGLMLLRSAIDEIVDANDYRVMLADIEALQAQIEDERAEHDEEIERLTTRIRILQNDLNVSRSENWQKHAGPNSRPAVDLADAPVQPDPARDDAQMLLQRAYSNQNWGKDAMRTECDMTSTRREAAISLLVRRGIATRGNKQTYLNFRDESDALTRLLGDEKSS
ncbi:MAG: hypothetical protein KAX65_08415 [Caldilineaceae bacterium]|nr:hypothetical protein [Caldilineaceae bacterium]